MVDDDGIGFPTEFCGFLFAQLCEYIHLHLCLYVCARHLAVPKLQSTAFLWAFFMTIVSCFPSVLQVGGNPKVSGILSASLL